MTQVSRRFAACPLCKRGPSEELAPDPMALGKVFRRENMPRGRLASPRGEARHEVEDGKSLRRLRSRSSCCSPTRPAMMVRVSGDRRGRSSGMSSLAKLFETGRRACKNGFTVVYRISLAAVRTLEGFGEPAMRRGPQKGVSVNPVPGLLWTGYRVCSEPQTSLKPFTNHLCARPHAKQRRKCGNI